jgi:hypothetical protein
MRRRAAELRAAVIPMRRAVFSRGREFNKAAATRLCCLHVRVLARTGGGGLVCVIGCGTSRGRKGGPHGARD